MNGPFVPIEDVANHFSVSISTIRGWVRKGHIPKNTYIKVGNTYRFSIDNVASALTQQHEDNVSLLAISNSPEAIMADGLEAQADAGIPDDHWSKEITADEDF
jgi:hypothetical protein